MFVPLFIAIRETVYCASQKIGRQNLKTVNNQVSQTKVKILTHGRLTLLRLMTIN